MRAALALKRGVSGYVLHTVTVALQACLAHPNDLRRAVQAVICCGCDTDTTAAIVGTGVGRDGLPPDWLEDLWEWPRTRDWIETLGGQLSRALACGTAATPPSLPAAGLLLRNLLFLLLVLLCRLTDAPPRERYLSNGSSWRFSALWSQGF